MDEKQERMDALQSIPWFQELDQEHFERISEIAHIARFDQGEALFKEGDQEDYLYIVVEGRIAIEIYGPVRGRIRIFTAEPLDVVGWSSVTPVVRQRTAGASAVLDSRLIALDAKALRQLCEQDHDLGYIVMRRMANVVAGRLMVTRLQLLDLFAHPTGEGGND